MSEWSAIQKKPKSRLRQALIEIEDKANPRRANLTKEEQTRIAKLTDIAARLRRRENVQKPSATNVVKRNRQRQKTQNQQTSHLFVHNHRYQINKTKERNVRKLVKSARFVAV